MKRAKRFFGFLLAWCMVLAVWCAALPVSVAAASSVDETDEVLVLANGSDVTNPQMAYVGSSNNVVWGGQGIPAYNSEHTRMFSQSAQFNVGLGSQVRYGTHPTTTPANNYTFGEYGGYGAGHGILNKQTSYQYINFWVYSPKAFTVADSSDSSATPTITFLVNWHDGNSDAGAQYYTIPVDWGEGWKLVSKKISEMDTYTGTGVNTSYGWRIAANLSTPNLSTGVDEVKWKTNAENYLCVDYVYLSKEAPLEAMVITGDSAGMSDGNVTYSVITEKELSSITNAKIDTDKISVQKDGGAPVEGISAAFDNNNKNQLNLSLGKLDDGTYTVTLKPDFAYDVYGRTLAAETTKKFTVKDGSVVTENFLMLSSDPANEAKSVPVGTNNITVNFNNRLSVEALNVNITAGEAPLAQGNDYTASAEDKTLTITMKYELLPEKEYTVDLSNLKDIAEQSLSGGMKSITFTTGKQITYNIDFEDGDTAKWENNSETDPLTIEVKEAEGNHYLKISKEAGKSQNYIYLPFRGEGENQVPADSDFTVKYRVYFDEVTAPCNLAISADNSPSAGLLMKHPKDSTLLRVQHTDAANTAPTDAQEFSLAADHWHEVCIVYDQGSKRGHLYLNNIDTGYTVYNRGNMSLNNLYFGIEGNSYTGSFCIDDIKIYDRQLPPETVEVIKPEITAGTAEVSAWAALDAGVDIRTGAVLILAQYDADGNLLSTTLQNITLKQATDINSAKLKHGYGDLMVSAELANGVKKVKALLWNGLDAMMPYTYAAISDI